MNRHAVRFEYVLLYSRYGVLFETPFYKGFKDFFLAQKEKERLVSSGVDFAWIYERIYDN